MRRAAKIDRNQPAIVSALRDVGASVQSLAMIGAGVPDLMVAFRGVVFLLEVKDPAQIPSKRQLTPDQVEWHRRWGGKVHIVETIEDAFNVIGVSG